jgi:hypothetical protein
MRKLIGIVALWMLAGPALAQPQSWAQIAATFGCTHQIQDSPLTADRPGQLEFIPAGEQENAWSRIYTVTLAAAPQDEAGANAAVERFIMVMRQTFERGGARFAAFDRFNGIHGQVAFLEFVVGNEPNIAVIHRAAPGLMVIQQLAVRGKAPTADDRRRLRALIGLSD